MPLSLSPATAPASSASSVGTAGKAGPPEPPRPSGVAAALLLPLTELVPVMSAPCPMHPSVDLIGAELTTWAREVGLEPPPGAGFERMAGRAFCGFGVESALLFAKWLTWLFHFDDEWDEKPAGRAAEIVEATFARLDLVARTPSHASSAVELAFGDLWRATTGRMSTRWRHRFLAGLAAQGEACRTEAENRCAGRVPSPAEYPRLRRGTAGPYLFDLVEPCLGVEVPAGLRESTTWRTLVDACNDVTAWCNDVASHHKERANGDVHNYVTVAATAFGLSDTGAVSWVNNRIAARAEDLRTSARRLPALFDRFGFSTGQARDVSKVACAFLTAPRAQLEWLLESSRYDVP
ncbi:terpene synthase family protein [Streptosporangium sp. G11]|uniref:terpene synthase family protein n=1 Tax=Streptosporangium sp. G11 TaxID=3436926 RepID=UPI003EBD94EA